MPTARRALLICFLILAACGDDDALATPDAGGGPATLAEVCAEVAAITCAGLSDCSCRFDTRPYDAAGCAAARAAECEAAGAAVAADIAAGVARIDEAALTRCLAAMSTLVSGCERLDPFLPECRDFVQATAAVGAACGLSGGGLAYCAGGAGICHPESGGCTALPARDEACLDGLCAGGLVCVAGACATPGGPGAACEPGSCAAGLVCLPGGLCGERVAPGFGCDAPGQCQDGYSCDPGGQCAPAKAALDEPCRGSDVCGDGHACAPAPENRTCAAPVEEGGVCEDEICAAGLACDVAAMMCEALPGDSEPCPDFLCAPGLTCVDGTMTCAPLPGLDEPCAIGARHCQDGLGCEESSGTCQPPAGENQPCVLNGMDHLCAEGLGCDFAPAGSICIPVGGAGSPCTNDRVCGDGTYCEFSELLCKPRLAAGEACEDGNECAAGLECRFVAGVPQCAVIPAAGEPCQFGCEAPSICQGPGGACAAAICATP